MKNESRGKRAALVMAGVLIGASLPSAVMAAENYPKVVRSSQEFFVDGRRVGLKAYAIGGHNYVKLRDIGKAVDFSVSYDPLNNAAIIVSGMPYQGGEQMPASSSPTPVPTVAAPASIDYAAQANPKAFTEELTRQAYNGIRDTILHREEIIAGTCQLIPTGEVQRNSSVEQAIFLWAGAPSTRLSTTKTDKQCATPGTLRTTNQPQSTPRNSLTASLD